MYVLSVYQPIIQHIFSGKLNYCVVPFTPEVGVLNRLFYEHQIDRIYLQAKSKQQNAPFRLKKDQKNHILGVAKIKNIDYLYTTNQQYACFVFSKYKKLQTPIFVKMSNKLVWEYDGT